MNEIISAQPKTTADYKAAFARLLDEIARMEEKMQADRIIIERLQVETQILQAESDLIKARTQERLNALMGAE